MAKRFFGYVDPSTTSREIIQTAGVAGFDTDKMHSVDLETLTEYENGNSDLAEEILDSVYPSKVYFSIDNLNSTKKFSLQLIGSGDWPVDAQNIFKSLKEAWQQIYLDKKLIFKEIFEGRVH